MTQRSMGHVQRRGGRDNPPSDIDQTMHMVRAKLSLANTELDFCFCSIRNLK